MKLFIVFGVCAAFPEANLFAQTAAEIKNSPDWGRAMVYTDGASVYSKPDFDAPVADYLSFKTPIWAARKATPGSGGLGLFHRVRYKSKAGYMADTDLRMIDKGAAPIAKSDDKETASDRNAEEGSPKKKKKKKAVSKIYEEEPDESQSVYFKRFAGLAVASVNFTEKFPTGKLHDQMLMYGLRALGPGTLFDGPPIDFNFWFSLQKPGYYKSFATKTPVSGFLLFGDLNFMIPLYEWKNALLTVGFGPMWTYTNYKVTIKTSHFDSQEFRVGVDGGVGLTYKIKHFALRGDAKYYFERTQYYGFVASFLMEY